MKYLITPYNVNLKRFRRSDYLTKYKKLNISTQEVAGGWRRLHNEELYNPYTLHQILLG
jgi:hypothetical protein